MKNFHYVGEESVDPKTSDSQTICLWKIGEFSKFRPLFGGKDTDDELPAQGFVKPPPRFSLDELKHMSQYAELKPAYDFLSFEGVKARDCNKSCFISLPSEAPHPILQTTLTLSNERSLQVLFDTCSSLDLIDKNTAKQCGFPLRKSEKISFRVAGGQRVV